MITVVLEIMSETPQNLEEVGFYNNDGSEVNVRAIKVTTAAVLPVAGAALISASASVDCMAFVGSVASVGCIAFVGCIASVGCIAFMGCI